MEVINNARTVIEARKTVYNNIMQRWGDAISCVYIRVRVRVN